MDIQYDMIGKRIHTRRKELHIKQGELAERIDISNNHLSSIETGKQKPSLETALHLCDALDVTPDYLFLGNMHQDNVSENIIEKPQAMLSLRSGAGTPDCGDHGQP